MDPVTPLTPEQVAEQEAEVLREGYLHRALVAFDIFCNVVMLRGQEDETISSHAARACEEGKLWGRWMCAFLNLFQANHGPKAQSGDLRRAETIEILEKRSGGLEE